MGYIQQGGWHTGEKMLGRTILAVLTYVLGLVALAIWSMHGFLTGAPREDWALMIVLPFAWAISFWPMLASLVMIARIWHLQRTVEKLADEIEPGCMPGTENLDKLEDIATAFAAHENRLPQFVVRPFIRRVLRHAARDGRLKRILEKGSKKTAT
jgi:hypothetical protein